MNELTFTNGDNEMVGRLLPSDVLNIFKRHTWTPIAGQVWVLEHAIITSACGIGAVVLDRHPEATALLKSTEGDTRRASIILTQIAKLLGCGPLYAMEFTFGFDAGFLNVMKGREIEWSREHIELRERAGIMGLSDGILTGKMVAQWWKNRTEHETR